MILFLKLINFSEIFFLSRAFLASKTMEKLTELNTVYALKTSNLHHYKPFYSWRVNLNYDYSFK